MHVNEEGKELREQARPLCNDLCFIWLPKTLTTTWDGEYCTEYCLHYASAHSTRRPPLLASTSMGWSCI